MMKGVLRVMKTMILINKKENNVKNELQYVCSLHPIFSAATYDILCCLPATISQPTGTFWWCYEASAWGWGYLHAVNWNAGRDLWTICWGDITIHQATQQVWSSSTWFQHIQGKDIGMPATVYDVVLDANWNYSLAYKLDVWPATIYHPTVCCFIGWHKAFNGQPRYLARGICALHDALQPEWEVTGIWPSLEELQDLITKVDYLIPKNADGSYKYKRLKNVCFGWLICLYSFTCNPDAVCHGWLRIHCQLPQG